MEVRRILVARMIHTAVVAAVIRSERGTTLSSNVNLPLRQETLISLVLFGCDTSVHPLFFYDGMTIMERSLARGSSASSKNCQSYRRTVTPAHIKEPSGGRIGDCYGRCEICDVHIDANVLNVLLSQTCRVRNLQAIRKDDA